MGQLLLVCPYEGHVRTRSYHTVQSVEQDSGTINFLATAYTQRDAHYCYSEYAHYSFMRLFPTYYRFLLCNLQLGAILEAITPA